MHRLPLTTQRVDRMVFIRNIQVVVRLGHIRLPRLEFLMSFFELPLLIVFDCVFYCYDFSFWTLHVLSYFWNSMFLLIFWICRICGVLTIPPAFLLNYICLFWSSSLIDPCKSEIILLLKAMLSFLEVLYRLDEFITIWGWLLVEVCWACFGNTIILY